MSIYDFKIKQVGGDMVTLDKYKGKVMLIVNTAPKCGFAPQYAGLQELYKNYQSDGLEILDFPCNQFANQAPDSDEANVSFCQVNFGVTFETFAKINVNGVKAAPLYKYLKKQQSGLFGGRIKWNFTKFLVDRNGVVVKRYAPAVEPSEIASDIKKVLSVSV